MKALAFWAAIGLTSVGLLPGCKSPRETVEEPPSVEQTPPPTPIPSLTPPTPAISPAPIVPSPPMIQYVPRPTTTVSTAPVEQLRDEVSSMSQQGPRPENAQQLGQMRQRLQQLTTHYGSMSELTREQRMTVEEDVNRALAAIDQASSATSAERLQKSLRDARRALEDVERDVRFGPPAP